MGRDHLQCSAWRRNFASDGASRLAFSIGNIADLRISDRPPAYEGLAVFAVHGGNGLGAYAVSAERSLQSFEWVNRARGPRPPRIDFLKRNHVRLVRLDKRDHPIQVETGVPAMGAVDVPRHYANHGGFLGSHNGSLRWRRAGPGFWPFLKVHCRLWFPKSEPKSKQRTNCPARPLSFAAPAAEQTGLNR